MAASVTGFQSYPPPPRPTSSKFDTLEAETEGDDLMPVKAPKLVVAAAAALVEARLDVTVVGVVHALVAMVGTAEDAAFWCILWTVLVEVVWNVEYEHGPGAKPPAAAAAISLSSYSYSCSSSDASYWNGVRLWRRLCRRSNASDLDDAGCCLDVTS